MTILSNLLNTNNLLPHGFCISWTPSLLWTYVISDAFIMLAYYSIPITLAYFIWRRKDLEFRWIFILFGAFILACGTTHLLGIITLWYPIYWLDAGMKGITAFISVSTAVALVWLVPKALKLPSPAQLDQEVKNRLNAFEALKVAQASLVNANEALENRVNERTQTLNLQKNLYEMLSQTNHAIVRIRNQDELFQEICRIVVDIGKFNFVWVGMFDPNSDEVLPAYRYGNDFGYIDNLHINLRDAVLGPTAKVHITGEPIVTNNFLSNVNTIPWHSAAKLAGVKASGVFPIKLNGKVIGSINLYSSEADYFTDNLLPTLIEMADDVSFALENFSKEDMRMRQAEILNDLNRDFASFLEVSTDFIYFKDIDNRFRFCSRTLAEMTGRADWHDMIGKDDFDVFPEETAKIYRAEEAVIFNEGLSVINKVNPYFDAQGKKGWVETNKWPLFDVTGKVTGLFGISRDITEHKRMEEELKASAEQFRGLVEQAIAGIYIIQDGVFVYSNHRFAEIFGFASSVEIIGLNPMLIVDERDRSLVSENIRIRAVDEENDINYTFSALRKDGSKIDVGVHGAQASYRGRPAVIGLLQDISEKKRDEDKIQHYIAQLQDAFMNTVEVAMNLSEMRDPYTAGHERRVAEIAVAISAELGFDLHRQQGIRVAGYLHDIGKITIPAEILSKPGKLSAIEYSLIKGHAQASYDALKGVDFPWPVAQVALQHHERIDGTGYPQGLKGEGIIIEARILAVADVVEAMSSHRPYRAGLGIEAAMAEIVRGRGTIFDAAVVDACVRLFKDKGCVLPS
ncbi:MAG: PAS domain S-box protein [Methylotenera sp.]|nr:PAS domain S-box protein [Methylotenera sp.]